MSAGPKDKFKIMMLVEEMIKQNNKIYKGNYLLTLFTLLFFSFSLLFYSFLYFTFLLLSLLHSFILNILAELMKIKQEEEDKKQDMRERR